MARADRTERSGTRADRRVGRRRRPRPTVVVLVRHGATDTTGRELPGRAPGLHLSEAGRRQADGAAKRLAELFPAVAAVYSSPLERTRETAAPIADTTGNDIVIDDGLLELDVGEWTGIELKVARKRKEWTGIQRYPSGFTFPGGESFVAMQGRMVGAMDRIRADHAGEVVVAVSHADPIRAVVAHALGTHLDLFQRVVVSPCSLTAIAYGDEGPTVLTVNDTGATGALVPS
ncbi:MAG: MSMEG_4193 family putative phosphomutase [Acidimicrobiia bacterium]